ncbi:MAG: hypothetical protein NTZ09_02585 [Candidatus Hydrogenedentes bacterium]|nr:hypothetical protein [Candidatus Hydrogenedentota bacterium]
MAVKRRGRRFTGLETGFRGCYDGCNKVRVNKMIYYYVYMALLVTSLVLWIIIAVREDGGENGDTKQGD